MSDPQGTPPVPSTPTPAAPEVAPAAAPATAPEVVPATTPEVASPAAPATAPEVAPEPGLPGAHRGGFSRLPTAPIGITVESAPDELGSAFDAPVAWGPVIVPPARRGVAAWALAASIIGLVVSLFVGWGFPIGLVGVIAAIVALRRPVESRGVAAWAIVLGILSILYSAGWLLYAASRASLFV